MTAKVYLSFLDKITDELILIKKIIIEKRKVQQQLKAKQHIKNIN
jgi:hypothetical protein